MAVDVGILTEVVTNPRWAWEGHKPEYLVVLGLVDFRPVLFGGLIFEAETFPSHLYKTGSPLPCSCLKR